MKDDPRLEALRVRLEESPQREQIRVCDEIAAGQAEAAGLVPSLLRVLLTGPTQVRSAALRALARARRPGQAGLHEIAIVAMNDPLPLLRVAATEALRASLQASGPEADDDRAELRVRVAQGVARLPGSEPAHAASLCAELAPWLLDPAGSDDHRDLFAALAGALRDDEARTRRSAAEALGALGPRADGAREALARATDDGDAEVAHAALRALLRVAPASPAIPDAIRRLVSRDPFLPLPELFEICSDAFRATPDLDLGDLLPLARRKLGEAGAPALRIASCGLLGEAGGEADAGLLVDLLREPHWSIRAAAKDALVRLARRGVSVVAAVGELRASPSPIVRSSAIEVLGSLASLDPRARQIVLASALGDRDASVRETASFLLEGVIGDGDVVAMQAGLAADQPVARRRSVIQALFRVGAPAVAAVPLVTSCLRDPDARVRAGACLVLGRLAEIDPSCAPVHLALPEVLRRLAERGPRVPAAARWALERLKHAAPRQLDLGLVLSASPDWSRLYRHVYCRRPLPGPIETGLSTSLRGRLRWYASRSRDSLSPDPGSLCQLGVHLAGTRARLLVARIAASGPDERARRIEASASDKEFAWLVARYCVLSRSELS